MSTTAALTTTATLPNLPPLPETDRINSINDFIVRQAEALPDIPLICYPSDETTDATWATYTARDLDQYADEAAKALTAQGLRPSEKRTSETEIVALLGPSTFDYVIALLALTRMGVGVMLLSTRLHTDAYLSLLKKTKCHNILIAPGFEQTVKTLEEQYELCKYSLPDRSIYARTPSSPRYQRQIELIDEGNCVSFVVHSSGSTGLPKPIFQTHRACLSNYAQGSGMRAFVTLPLFHNHGLCTLFRGIVSRKKTMLYGAGLPLTNGNLVRAMNGADFESFHAVPYALKILSETDEGIAALSKCKLVLFGGSSCPDDLGDKLVENGVYIVSHYGATEMGQLMTSYRAPEDKAWNYVRPLAKVSPYLRFDPVGEGLYECVVLDGLPTKLVSNSDDPPNSFRTRDTFVPHPTLADAWKYVGRLDDRVTLFNGEKVLPVPYEHQIRQSELVKESLVFGVGRAFPGLLVVPSDQAKDLSASEVLAQITPLIQKANVNTEKFSKVPLEMVEILPYGSDYPQTDKGTIIRAACYQKFASLIDSIYTRFETPVKIGQGSLLKLGFEELQRYLHHLLRDVVDVKVVDLDTDFFAAGADSLQAITARGHLMRQLDLGGNVLSNNVVFDYSSIRKLSQHLYSLSSGMVADVEDEISIMQRLVAKYSEFQAFIPGEQNPQGDVILLTGATGSLGAHILAQLLPRSHIRYIYCLVRASSLPAANDRVVSALASRNLPLSCQSKLVALPSDLSRPDLGLGPLIFNGIRDSLTHVIHSAWAVNFNLGVASFEPQQIAGLRHLLDLCLSVPFATPANLAFVSSVSAAAGTPIPGRVPEQVIANPAHAQAMGYARSKWVAEHIVSAAAATTGINARVLRSGQMIGDSIHGLWNPTEAIPLMLHTAATLGVLPRLEESPAWLPMDVCAGACIELAGFGAVGSREVHGPEVVFHVQNTVAFSWNDDLLPALRASGLNFEEVSQREWVERLRTGEQDPKRNPAIKLLDFFAGKYDNDRPGRKGLEFDMSRTRRESPILDSGFDVIRRKLMVKCVEAWKQDAWN